MNAVEFLAKRERIIVHSNESAADRIEREATECRALAKDVSALSADVVGCRLELRKIAAEHPGALTKGADLAEHSLSSIEAKLADLGRRLEKIGRQPVPLPFRPPHRAEVSQ